jgi:hypothetical protein
MVDPGEDFSGNMENLAASEASEASDQQHQTMLDAHMKGVFFFDFESLVEVNFSPCVSH